MVVNAHILHAGSMDAPAMARIHKTGFSHPWDESALRNLMDKTNCLTLAAFEAPDELVGFVMTRQAANECEILTIVASSKKRRSGIANALMSHTLELSRLRQAKRMFLDVASDNKAAMALYKRHGFAEISRRTGYYQQGRSSPVDALVMALDL